MICRIDLKYNKRWRVMNRSSSKIDLWHKKPLWSNEGRDEPDSVVSSWGLTSKYTAA
jgi:hypothetical protein